MTAEAKQEEDVGYDCVCCHALVATKKQPFVDMEHAFFADLCPVCFVKHEDVNQCDACHVYRFHCYTCCTTCNAVFCGPCASNKIVCSHIVLGY